MGRCTVAVLTPTLLTVERGAREAAQGSIPAVASAAEDTEEESAGMSCTSSPTALFAVVPRPNAKLHTKHGTWLWMIAWSNNDTGCWCIWKKRRRVVSTWPDFRACLGGRAPFKGAGQCAEKRQHQLITALGKGSPVVCQALRSA